MCLNRRVCWNEVLFEIWILRSSLSGSLLYQNEIYLITPLRLPSHKFALISANTFQPHPVAIGFSLYLFLIKFSFSSDCFCFTQRKTTTDSFQFDSIVLLLPLCYYIMLPLLVDNFVKTYLRGWKFHSKYKARVSGSKNKQLQYKTNRQTHWTNIFPSQQIFIELLLRIPVLWTFTQVEDHSLASNSLYSSNIFCTWQFQQRINLTFQRLKPCGFGFGHFHGTQIALRFLSIRPSASENSFET